MGHGRRHDARGRQRHRRGFDPGRAGGRHARARAAGGALHGHRGDRHGRRLRAAARGVAGRNPAQPRFRGGGRAVRGLCRRARREHDVPLCGGADARRGLRRREDLRQGPQGRPFGHSDRLPARQCQQTAVPAAQCRALPPAALLGGRRRTAQRHSARGRSRCAAPRGGLRRFRRGGRRVRKDRAGGVRRDRGEHFGHGREVCQARRNAAARRGREGDPRGRGVSRRRAAHVALDARAGADVGQPGARGLRTARR